MLRRLNLYGVGMRNTVSHDGNFLSVMCVQINIDAIKNHTKDIT